MKSKFFKKKNLVIALIALAAIAAVAVIVVLAFEKKSENKLGLEKPAPQGLQVQAYATAAVPSLEDGDLILGSKDAPLKIFVYEDGSSQYSANLAETLDKLSLEEGSKLAVIARPFFNKGDQDAETAALAVSCANDQDKGKEMRALLFSQAKGQAVATADIKADAGQLGLDAADFSTCLTNPEKLEKIEKLNAEAAGYEVLGAPTMFVGSEMVVGARPYDDYTDSNGDHIEGLKSLVSRKLGK